MWTLQSGEPAELELTFRLLPGNLKPVGGAARADFVVDAALVSRVHCRFALTRTTELELEDVGSTNGTFVNGKKVGKTMLSDGDKLTVGRVLFVVNAAAPRARITAEATLALSQHGTVAPVMIHQRTDFAASMIDGRTVMEVDPDGRSAQEIAALWTYVADRLEKNFRRTVFAAPGALSGQAGLRPATGGFGRRVVA